jgi:hypothetical protein
MVFDEYYKGSNKINSPNKIKTDKCEALGRGGDGIFGLC